MEETELIWHYFEEGHSYTVFVDMLLTYHFIRMYLRSLKTHLKDAGMSRRKNYSPLNDLRNAIRAELSGPGQLFGYRSMWLAVVQKHILRVKCDDVMWFLQELNPQGTEQRTRRRLVRHMYHSMGPNYLWHMKTKVIWFRHIRMHWWFSRHILWLTCGSSNNDSAVIAHNFITCVQRLGFAPMRLRTDCGMKNGTLAAIQCTLCHHHSDYYVGSRSHMHGTSMSEVHVCFILFSINEMSAKWYFSYTNASTTK